MSSANNRLTQEQRIELSDRRMFDAAMDLILEHGTVKTTLKSIGEKAGYSRGLANMRFGSKEKLYEELVKRCYSVWLRELGDVVGNKVGVQALMASAEAFETYLTEAPRELRVLQILRYEFISHQSILKEKLKEQQEKMLTDITGYLARAQFNNEISKEIDVAEFAVKYLAFIFGIIYMWLVDAESVPVARIFASYRKSMYLELGIKQ